MEQTETYQEFSQRLRQELMEELRQEIKAEMVNGKLFYRSTSRPNPVNVALKQVEETYGKEIRSYTGAHVFPYIQRTACLMNGYILQNRVREEDAETVAKTLQELCEVIIKNLKEKKK